MNISAWLRPHFSSHRGQSPPHGPGSTMPLNTDCYLHFLLSFPPLFSGTNGMSVGAISQSTALSTPAVGCRQLQCFCPFSRTLVSITVARHSVPVRPVGDKGMEKRLYPRNQPHLVHSSDSRSHTPCMPPFRRGVTEERVRAAAPGHPLRPKEVVMRHGWPGAARSLKALGARMKVAVTTFPINTQAKKENF